MFTVKLKVVPTGGWCLRVNVASALPSRQLGLVCDAPETTAARAPEAVAARVPEAVAARVPEAVAARVPEAVAARVPEAVAARVPEASQPGCPRLSQQVPELSRGARCRSQGARPAQRDRVRTSVGGVGDRQVPAREPVAVGWNATPTPQDACAGIDAPHVLAVTTKSPDAVTAEIASAV